MQAFTRISLLFFSVLITYINSGLIRIDQDAYSFSLKEETTADRFLSLVDVLQLTNIEFGAKHKISSGKVTKFSNELNPWQFQLKYRQLYRKQAWKITSLYKDPDFRVSVLKSPDICFPFNYFW